MIPTDMFLNFYERRIFLNNLKSAKVKKEDNQISFFWKTQGRGHIDDDITLTINSSEGWVYFECYEKREMTTWLFTKTTKGFDTKCVNYIMEGGYVGEDTIPWELSNEDKDTLNHLLSGDFQD